MRSITVTMWVTLDGVVQGLGRPDEDTRGGFTHGGWGPRYDDEVMGREMAKAMTRPGDMLLGRRTWQDFTTAWGRLTDGYPVTTRMNATTKYVVSRTLEDADRWQNSVLLRGDAVSTVAELKAQPGGDLGIIGSVSLVRSLHLDSRFRCPNRRRPRRSSPPDARLRSRPRSPAQPSGRLVDDVVGDPLRDLFRIGGRQTQDDVREACVDGFGDRFPCVTWVVVRDRQDDGPRDRGGVAADLGAEAV